MKCQSLSLGDVADEVSSALALAVVESLKMPVSVFDFEQ